MANRAATLRIVEPLDFIRRHPEIFLPQGRVDPIALTLNLLADILFLCTKPVSIYQHDQWWIISSTDDWLPNFQGSRTVEQCFTRAIAFPERSVNDVHGEVILAALSDRLITATPTSCLVIVGSVPADEQAAILATVPPNWGRLVAFQLGRSSSVS